MSLKCSLKSYNFKGLDEKWVLVWFGFLNSTFLILPFLHNEKDDFV